ncbi:glycosyltransferase family 4 protein [Candidatus Woesearchaeota archaeon]|nr:glycosyltransferase family 4 protein [Candidatus Woesearchaeota archaeon]
MKNPKVVLVGQYNPSHEELGGIENYIKSLHQYLIKKKLETYIVGWGKHNENIKNFTSIIKSNKIRGAVFSMNLLVKAPFIKIPKNAVIHVHRPDHILPFMLRKNKIICTLHGAHVENIRLKKGFVTYMLYNVLQKIALRRADKIMAVSDETKNYFVTKYPFVKNKITVIPPAVGLMFKPLDRKKCRKGFGLRNGEKILLYLGRLEKEKQVDILIKLISNTKYKVIIAGAGREEQRLKEQAQGSKNIAFIGEVYGESVPKLINCADALVLLSKHEGMPTVVLESLACGIPVLSTDTGDVRKVVIDGKTGFIVTPDNLLQKTEKLINSRNLKKNCLKIAEKYSWNNIGNEIVALYQELEK